MGLKSFKDLLVWQKSIELVKETYKLTRKLPKDELYGLSLQMRRAAVSIPSNIAEGQKRKNIGEYKQFLWIANASAGELETQLIIIKEVHGITIEIALSLNTEVQKMLTVLIQKLSPIT